jgi:hypothetical protein
MKKNPSLNLNRPASLSVDVVGAGWPDDVSVVVVDVDNDTLAVDVVLVLLLMVAVVVVVGTSVVDVCVVVDVVVVGSIELHCSIVRSSKATETGIGSFW